MGAIEVDDESWPLLLVRMEGRPTDREFEDYLHNIQGYLDRGEPYALVISTTQGMPISSPSHLKVQAAWTRRNEDTIRKNCCGIAFVLPSPAMRGVLRAAMSLQGLPTEHAVFRSEPDGLAWTRSRLEHAAKASTKPKVTLVEPSGGS